MARVTFAKEMDRICAAPASRATGGRVGGAGPCDPEPCFGIDCSGHAPRNRHTCMCDPGYALPACTAAPPSGGLSTALVAVVAGLVAEAELVGVLGLSFAVSRCGTGARAASPPPPRPPQERVVCAGSHPRSGLSGLIGGSERRL